MEDPTNEGAPASPRFAGMGAGYLGPRMKKLMEITHGILTAIAKVEVLSDLFHSHLLEEQRTVYSSLRSALTSRQLLDLGERLRQGRVAVANPRDYLRS